jgi:hypothetical protein
MSNPGTCPVCRTAEVVCGKWTLLLIKELADGQSRFCELERALEGISPRTLSLRLRALEDMRAYGTRWLSGSCADADSAPVPSGQAALLVA